MKWWAVRIVPMSELERTLNELEQSYPAAGHPILTFVDQSRIIISWPYRVESNASTV